MKEIIFVGRSNVGKSTLLRAVTGKKLKTGKRPGVTKKPESFQFRDFVMTDMPGFGFMSGNECQEAVKDSIVQYIENNARNIVLAVLVVNAVSFAEIVDRWGKKNEIPVEVELYDFLMEMDIDVIVAANKMDKVDDVDTILDGIAYRFGMLPPWKQWIDRIVPLSAKRGELGDLKRMLQKKMEINWERERCESLPVKSPPI